jgi:hypothetical protein
MLRVSFYEDDSPPMTLDYKLLEPPKGASEEERKLWIDSMMGEGKDEKKREAEVAKAKPLMRLGVGSGVSEPQDDDKIELNEKGELTAEGYAVGTEGEWVRALDLPISHLIEHILLSLSSTGSPVALVELILLRDPGSSNLDAMEDLRRLANEQPASTWTRLELDENNSRKVLPKHKGSSADAIAIADAKEAKFSWSWTLWRAQVPVPAEAKGGEDKWALVVRGSKCSTLKTVGAGRWTSTHPIPSLTLPLPSRSHLCRRSSRVAIALEYQRLQGKELAGGHRADLSMKAEQDNLPHAAASVS